MGLTGKYLYGYDATTKTQTKVPLYYTAEDCADWSDIQMKLPAPYADYGYVYAPADLASNVANLETAYPGAVDIIDKNLEGEWISHKQGISSGVTRVPTSTYSGGWSGTSTTAIIVRHTFTLTKKSYYIFGGSITFTGYGGGDTDPSTCFIAVDGQIYDTVICFNSNNYEPPPRSTYVFAKQKILLNAGTHSLDIAGNGVQSATEDHNGINLHKVSLNGRNTRSNIIASNIHFTKGSTEYIFLSGYYV